jgi:Uma2 family endonuclease
MAAQGFFRPDERVELLDGKILTMAPQGSAHATAIHLAAKALAAAFGPGFHVRIQVPLVLGEFSEPEPDVAVVQGSERDYLGAHPSTALLVVEVSDATLEHHRKRKGRLYARSGIPEYWIVNLIDGRLEVFRNTVRRAGAPPNWAYGSVTHHARGESIAPLGMSRAQVAVRDLLP